MRVSCELQILKALFVLTHFHGTNPPNALQGQHHQISQPGTKYHVIQNKNVRLATWWK